MSWGIADTALEIEKIKAESADYLNGLNSCGAIDYDDYNYAFDFYNVLLDKAYLQGKKDVKMEVKKMKLIDPIELKRSIAFSSMVHDGKTLEQIIDEQPSVEPKTGRWITWKEAGNEIPSETRFECSICHDAAQTLCNGLDLLSLYCPNCGAKMGVSK